MTEHYFVGGGDYEPREFRVALAGAERLVEAPRGVFSHAELDQGTGILLDTVPDPAAGETVLDLGCGWGPIALEAALRQPEATVWAVDVNPLALEATRRNAARLGVRVYTAAPEDVPASQQYDLIWSNPPIRIGKPALHGMLETWLGRLTPSGEAFLVVQKHLGADSLQRWLDARSGFAAERYDSAKNFRILRVWRAE